MGHELAIVPRKGACSASCEPVGEKGAHERKKPDQAKLRQLLAEVVEGRANNQHANDDLVDEQHQSQQKPELGSAYQFS